MRVGLCALQGFFLADVSGPYVGVRYEETLVGSVSVDCFAFAVAEGIVISGVSYAKTSLVGYIFAESQTAVGMGVACYDDGTGDPDRRIRGSFHGRLPRLWHRNSRHRQPQG